MPPFYGKTDVEMNRRIRAGHYRFPDKYWSNISASAKDFISRLLTVDPAKRMSACDALQHGWMVSIGLHTNDLFADKGGAGVPELQARFGEFNLERRATIQTHTAMRDLLGLPEEEVELHRFRTAHAERAGHLVVTPAHLAFLAYDQSSMFSVPISEIVALRPATLSTHAAASDSSLRMDLSNGRTLQFDGFWERDECSHLLQACGRSVKHEILVESAEGGAPAAKSAALGAGAAHRGAEEAEAAAAAQQRVAAAADSATLEAGSLQVGMAVARSAISRALAAPAMAEDAPRNVRRGSGSRSPRTSSGLLVAIG